MDRGDGQLAQVREIPRCCATGFEEGRRGHKPRNAGGLHLESGKCKEMSSHLEPPEVRQDYQLLDVSPVKLILDFSPLKESKFVFF